MTTRAGEVLRYTLVSDGTSDRGLLPILDWLVGENASRPWRGQFAEGLGGGRLAKRVSVAVKAYPCDLLFVHRDAETHPRVQRLAEIAGAVAEAGIPYVPVVPVRMSEAWLLIDEEAVRCASGNPNGKVAIRMPPAKTLELLADPKRVLFALLRDACELGPRRLRKFNVEARRNDVARYISEERLSGLRQLAAFRLPEQDVRTVLRDLGAAEPCGQPS